MFMILVLIMTLLQSMSKTNETRHIKWHETCKCKCRLDASVCKVDANNKVDANVKN